MDLGSSCLWLLVLWKWGNTQKRWLDQTWALVH